jgi:hypothetical protein
VLIPPLGQAGFRFIFFGRFYPRFLTQYNTRRYSLHIEIEDFLIRPEPLNSLVPEIPSSPLNEPPPPPSTVHHVHSLTHWMKTFHMVVDKLRPLVTIPVNF